MRQLIDRYWFFIGIAAAIAVAFNFPAAADAARKWNLVNIGVFLVFLTSGLELETSRMMEALKDVKMFFVIIASSLLLFPLVARGLAGFFFQGEPGFIVGACLIAAAPATIASGTVITKIAGGDVSLSLLICVLTNFVAVFSAPVSLDLMLSADNNISPPVLHMIGKLTVMVICPIIAGRILSLKIKEISAAWKKRFSIFSQIVVLLIIFRAAGGSVAHISGPGPGLVYICAFMISLRALMLGVNYGISKIMSLERSSAIAFTIHASQKTLTLSYVIWAGYFAAEFPAAMIPPIIYHLAQMIMDTFIARRLENARARESRP